MEKVLLDPTLEQVNATLAELCDRANKGQRSRTAEMVLTAEDWFAEAALWRAGGAGVANSYGYGGLTTVVGCCWVTVGGRRLVRVEAARVAAPKSAYGRREALPFGFGTAVTRWEKADEREVVRAGLWRAACVELAYAVPDWLGCSAGPGVSFTPADDRLSIIADWLDDRGRPTDHLRAYLLLSATPAAA